MSEATTGCAVDNCNGQQHIGYLCRAHYERGAQWLREIEDEAAMLTPLKSMAVVSGNRGAGPAFQRSPARLDAITLRDPRRGIGWSEDDEDTRAAGDTLSILNVLGSWARVVREERDLTWPTEVTVVSERSTLTAHWDWVSGQDWIDECYTELRALRSQLKACNGTQDEKPVGRCYLPAEDGACKGPIWVDLAAGHAHCGRCQQTWDGPQLAMLNYELERAKRPKDDRGEPMWTTAEIAARQRVKPGTIAVQAHRRGIESVNGYWDPRDFPSQEAAC